MTNKNGLTRTERFLNRLAQRSFLSLWSHPNCFRDVAKELCDLLVICHNVVIIFSDKEVKFDETLPPNLAWKRWYNRAVLKSLSQLKRAMNWVVNHPDRVFRDAQCTRQIPLFERMEEPLEIHLVAVANGAATSCIRHFGGGSGSLLVSPSEEPEDPEPFCIGRLGEPSKLVHVFDEAHLHVVLQELDTIRDFSDYLSARERLITNDNLFTAAGEEDLLAVYLKDVNEKGEHDFVWETGKRLEPNQKNVVQEGTYRNYQKAAPYKRKKKADRRSYLWDRLIEKFAGNYLSGTLAPVPIGLGLDGREGGAEFGLRHMALVRRVQRRAYADAINGAFEHLERSNGNRFFRAMLPAPGESDTGFCILLVNRDIAPPGTSFEDYRAYRAGALSAYTENLLERNRHLKRVVGIATEGSRRGMMSEDLIYHEPPEWTDEAVAAAKENSRAFRALTGELSQTHYSTLEYPETDTGLRGNVAPIPYRFVDRPSAPSNLSRGNRKQRRAAAAKLKKSRL